MIVIVSKDITKSDQDRMKFILGLKPLSIPESAIKFVDISSSDFKTFVPGESIDEAYFCMSNTFKDLAARLRRDKIYTAAQLLRGKVIDKESKFAAFAFYKGIRECAYPSSVADDKAELWNNLKEFFNLVKESGVGYDLSEVIPVEELPKDDVEKTFDKEISEEDPSVCNEQNADPDENKQQNVEHKDYIEIDVISVLNDVVSNIKMSDTGLGKSLSDVEKIVLNTKDGIVNIYPGNRIKVNDPGIHISYKDMCHIIKAAITLNAEKIKIYPVKE